MLILVECGPNEEFSDCPEFSRECESSCEWTLFPESNQLNQL
jgi:hypothetical protein